MCSVSFCRYLYIPLGGSRWRFLNVWIIFTFVAIWHDLEWWVYIETLYFSTFSKWTTHVDEVACWITMLLSYQIETLIIWGFRFCICRKLLSWAWVTCILWGPELLVKSIMRTPQVCWSISSLISISFLFYFTTWTHSKGWWLQLSASVKSRFDELEVGW